MSIHIYTARCQPATHFLDYCVPGKPIHFRYSPRHVFRCDECGRLRWAKNLSVQVYYDMIRFFCTETERYRRNWGCKHTANVPVSGVESAAPRRSA